MSSACTAPYPLEDKSSTSPLFYKTDQSEWGQIRSFWAVECETCFFFVTFKLRWNIDLTQASSIEKPPFWRLTLTGGPHRPLDIDGMS